jgi:subtilisin family serine protease
MLRALRNVLVPVLSACLICSPLFSFKTATAASAGDPQSNQIHKSTPSSSLAAHEPNTLLVKFHPDKITQAEHVINTVSQRYQRLRGPSSVIKLTLKADRDLNATLHDLRQLDGVIEWVEPNFIVKRAGDRSTRVRSSGFSRKRPSFNSMKATNEPPEGGATNTVIAVVDSGVDLRHRALKHHLWLNQSEKTGAAHDDDDLNGFIDDLRGWNFVADNNDVSDDLGHGAQVAGIIASQLDHQPSISILPLKALNHTGEGTVTDVVEAMDYAVARRAAVINCSFGAPAFSHAMLEAIKRAETTGIVVVAAAGNRGRSISESPFYPASFRAHQAPNLISVAATDRNNLLAGFSNFAADVAAPGESNRVRQRIVRSQRQGRQQRRAQPRRRAGDLQARSLPGQPGAGQRKA